MNRGISGLENVNSRPVSFKKLHEGETFTSNQYTKHPLSIEDRIFSKVEKTKTCWLWKGTVVNRHGVLNVNKKTTYVDKLAYSQTHGAVPRGKVVVHTCLNTLCLNPDHLSLSSPGKWSNSQRHKAELDKKAIQLLPKIGNADQKFQKKILAKVEREGSCLIWRGKATNGHAMIAVKRKMVYLDRLMYEAYSGTVPEDKIILHSCAKSLCVNPDHLILSTPRERNLDGMEDRKNVKLDHDKAESIRIEYEQQGMSIKQLKTKYRVSDDAIYRVIGNQTWKEN